MLFNGKPAWFDRITAYRVSASILLAQIVISLGTLDFGWWDVPSLARRIILWIGAGILFTAVAMDWWEVYRGRRDIERRIAARMRQDQTS